MRCWHAFRLLKHSQGEVIPMTDRFAEAPLAPAFNETTLSVMSDDECVSHLVRAMEKHDDSRLDQLALLLGRLAVAIE